MMMKVSTKTMSSPSRTDKFPPPLMRFLRSNVGSKSRGARSRSSPMFIRKKNTAIETTQEPSSPKVTCIGQVRVRRSSKKSRSNSGGGRSPKIRAPAKTPCSWVKKTLFCHHLGKRLRPRSFNPVFRKFVWFFRFGYCRTSEIRDNSSKMESNQQVDLLEEKEEEEEEEEVETKVVSTEALDSLIPPKNALLLTKCRSVPYRSSSQVSRFWGSPLMTSETEDCDDGDKTPESEPNCVDSSLESKTEQESEGKLGFCREFEGSSSSCSPSSINGKSREISVEELETGEGRGDSAPPLMLTRCKSEPARTGERLNPEARFC